MPITAGGQNMVRTPQPPHRGYLMISVEWVQVFQGLPYQLMGNVTIEHGQLSGHLQVKLRSRLGFCCCPVFGLFFLLLDGDPLLDCSQRVRSEGAEIPRIWEDHRVAPVIHLHPQGRDKQQILRELWEVENYTVCPEIPVSKHHIMGSTRVETEVRGPGNSLAVENVRRGDHYCRYKKNLGHRRDQNRTSFLEDLEIGGKLSSGSMSRRSSASKNETQASRKTVRLNRLNC